MRGWGDRAEGLFSYAWLDERVPPIIRCRRSPRWPDEAKTLNARFEGLYSSMERPSIPPEMLLRAMLLQALFSVRSERMLIEQIDYNLLLRRAFRSNPGTHPAVPKPAVSGSSAVEPGQMTGQAVERGQRTAGVRAPLSRAALCLEP